jgi:2,4-dienoyl-CoA reductase-like NADH-dependent reductase (Old Yellow Enzyme family)
MTTDPAAALAPLLAPFEMGPLRLRNRVAMAPMTRSRSPGGVPGPDMLDWYRRRAENGVGLIFTEGVRIPHPGANFDQDVPLFDGDEVLAGWDRIRIAVQAAGAKIIPQLWHIGLTYKPKIPMYDGPDADLDPEQFGPSGIAGGFGAVSERRREPMSQRDIDMAIEAYAVAAENAHRLGFDGVALHGAHGYLIDQFFWDKTNLRTDRYGGGIADRSTFAAEIVAEIRRRTAPGFPIVLRFSQWKAHDYDARLCTTPGELEAMLAPLVDAGVDMFDCSQRRFWEPEFEGSDLNLAGWTRKLSGRPSITVGSIGLDGEMIRSLLGESAGVTRIDRLLEMMARGDFDLAAVGRALIANPDWVELVKAGEWGGMRPYTPGLLEKVY